MTIQEAIEVIKRNKPDCDPRLCGVELKEACEVAIKALEKQIPQKARYKIVGNGWNDWAEGKCPACGVNAKNTPTYCPHCGQHVDWSDTDE